MPTQIRGNTQIIPHTITGNEINLNAQIPTSALTDGALFLAPPNTKPDAYYRHTQNTPSTTWVIVHGLNKRPAITVTDSAGTVVNGSIHHDSAVQATASYSVAFAGYAECS